MATLEDLLAALAKWGIQTRILQRDMAFILADEAGTFSDTRWVALPATGLNQEHLTDLTSLVQNFEELDMNIFSTDLFKYIQGDMIGDSQVRLTIAQVTMETISSGGRGGTQTKPCLHFREKDKTLILNKTNALTIAERLGPETDRWAGAVVTLSAPIIDAFGKSKRAVRVIGVEPAASVNGSKPRPAADPAPTPAGGNEQADLFGVKEPAAAGVNQYEQE